MKSPWKFLASLIPQRQPVEDREEYPARKADRQENADQQSKRDQNNPVPGPAPDENLSGESDTPTLSQPGERGTGIDATLTAADDPVENRAASRDDQAATQSTGAPRTQKQSKPRDTASEMLPNRATAARTARAKPGSTIAAARDFGRPVQSSPDRDAFFDEVESLDEEIQQLRIQLAQKLHLQNRQLRKMLERFDNRSAP